MNRLMLPVLCLLVWMSSPGGVRAAAFYYANGGGNLEITHIGTRSFFLDNSPGDEVDASEFVITVDPKFQNPELQIQKDPEIATGYGDYEASARSEATLYAVDPFNIRKGDRLSIYATVKGRADHADGSVARSSTAIAATIHAINRTEQDVFVDTLWRGCENVYALGFGNRGEFATASYSLNPQPVESCWIYPIVYRYAADTDNELTISASADGYASAIPEPSSIVIWTLIGVGGSVCAITRSRRRFSKT